jgi:hypothetical protein
MEDFIRRSAQDVEFWKNEALEAQLKSNKYYTALKKIYDVNLEPAYCYDQSVYIKKIAIKAICKCTTKHTCSGGEYVYTCDCPIHQERQKP